MTKQEKRKLTLEARKALQKYALSLTPPGAADVMNEGQDLEAYQAMQLQFAFRCLVALRSAN